jgi:hypothetical protein
MRRRDEQPPGGDQISGNVSGRVTGQVVVGKNIDATQALGDAAVAAVTQAELEELRERFAWLREQVAAQAPPERRDAAVERVGELQQAVLDGDKPDLTTIQYVTRWFGANLPKLAGVVTGVVVHPIVGRLVERGGEMLADEFGRLVGGDG